MATKNNRWTAAAGAAPSVVLASTDPESHSMFGGKTLREIGEAFDLSDDDVELYNNKLPDGRAWQTLLLSVNNKLYNIGLSRGMTPEILDNADVMLNCKMRVTFMTKVNDEGEAVLDEHGNELLDTAKPYMSFGKPDGITILDENREKLFAPATANTAAQTVAGAAPKAVAARKR